MQRISLVKKLKVTASGPRARQCGFWKRNVNIALTAFVSRPCKSGRVPSGARPHLRRRLAVLTAAVLMTMFHTAVNAGDAPPAQLISFDIPAQPLAPAIEAYSRATSVQVLYESGWAAGRQSVPLQGSFTPETGLTILLRDTGLVAHYTRSNAITLTLPSAENPDEPPAQQFGGADMVLPSLQVQAPAEAAASLRKYTGVLQTDIQNALRKNAKTRSGSYSVGIKLWLAPSGAVERAGVFRSTGDTGRDDAVLSVLQGLPLSQAVPANTPQPIRIVIYVKSL
jgi:hypothetical protein